MKTIYLHTFKAFLTAMLVAFVASCAEESPYETTPDNDKPISGGEMPEGAFLFVSGSSPGSSTFDQGVETRAYLDPATYTYYWHPGEEIRMTIMPTGETSATAAIASNVEMVGTNTDRVTQTHFVGNLTQELFDDLTVEGGSFDYYSYFQNNQAFAGMAFPTVPFVVPQSLTLEPNVFNRNYVPMVADPVTGEEPIIYIGTAEAPSGTLIDFDFKHILSYAAIEMDVALTSADVTSITLTNNNGTLLWGTYEYNLLTQTGAYTGGGSSLTLAISAGRMAPGPSNILFVPMPPVDMTGQTFTLTFNTTGSTNTYESITVPGINFQRGVIHKLRVAPRVKYTADDTFTLTKTGYYYIEAWGGDGGDGGKTDAIGAATGGTKGEGQRQAGLYYLSAGDVLRVQVGINGGDGADGQHNTGQHPGGSAGIGTWFGSGRAGGEGGDPDNNVWASGGGGGGGGAASGVLRNGIATANIILASGGGGGAGGAGGSERGGDGGDSGTTSDQTKGNSTDGGGSGGNGWSTTSTIGVSNNSMTGEEGNFGYPRGGGGGGGGGGGWNRSTGGGGSSGTGGDRNSTVLGSGKGGGGGGSGGGSSSGSEAANPGFTLPTNSRPTGRTDGYVVITFFRP